MIGHNDDIITVDPIDIIPPRDGGKRGPLRGTITKTTAQAIELVVGHGVDPKLAFQLTTNNPNPHPGSIKRFKTKVAKHALSTPSVVKKAYKGLVDTLDMKPLEVSKNTVTKDGEVINFTEKIYPTFTNRNDLIKEVFARYDPVIHQNLNVNADLTGLLPVDMDQYK